MHSLALTDSLRVSFDTSYQISLPHIHLVTARDSYYLFTILIGLSKAELLRTWLQCIWFFYHLIRLLTCMERNAQVFILYQIWKNVNVSWVTTSTASQARVKSSDLCPSPLSAVLRFLTRPLPLLHGERVQLIRGPERSLLSSGSTSFHRSQITWWQASSSIFNPTFSNSAFLPAQGSLSNLCSTLCCSLTSAPPLRKARKTEQRNETRGFSLLLLTVLPTFLFCSPLPDNVETPIMFSLVSLNVLTY